MQFWLTSINHTSWAECPLLPTTKGLLCAKPFSSTNIRTDTRAYARTHARTHTHTHAHTHTAEMHIDRISHSVHKTETDAHTYIHTLGVPTLGSRLLQTVFVMINSFHKPYEFPSPTEIRAVMATERKQRLQHEGWFVGTSCTRAENWDAAEVWAERISHECVSNYHSEADKGYQNNEQNQFSSLCLRRHSVTANPIINTGRKLEIHL